MKYADAEKLAERFKQSREVSAREFIVSVARRKCGSEEDDLKKPLSAVVATGIMSRLAVRRPGNGSITAFRVRREHSV